MMEESGIPRITGHRWRKKLKETNRYEETFRDSLRERGRQSPCRIGENAAIGNLSVFLSGYGAG